MSSSSSQWPYLVLISVLLPSCDSSKVGETSDARATKDGAVVDPLCATFANADDIPFVGHEHVGSGGSDTFAGESCHRGDAIVFQVACRANDAVSSVIVSAPGWTLVPIGSVTGSTTGGVWAATFGAIAPDPPSRTTFSVNWTPAVCYETWEVGDELTHTSPTQLALFDSHAEATGVGDCAETITTGGQNDIVWGACSSSTQLVAFGAGFLPGTSDGDWHWSEYRVTSDPAGSAEVVGFTNSANQSFVLTAVTAARTSP